MSYLELRALQPADLPLRAQWLQNEQQAGTMPLEGTFAEANTNAWYERVANDTSRTDTTLVADNDAAAMGGLTGFDPQARSAELYIFVSPNHRGAGFGRQLVVGLCDLGFTHLKLNRVYLWTLATNEAAQSLFIGCNFRVEGQLRSHMLVHGRLVDRIVMGQLASEWSGASVPSRKALPASTSLHGVELR